MRAPSLISAIILVVILLLGSRALAAELPQGTGQASISQVKFNKPIIAVSLRNALKAYAHDTVSVDGGKYLGWMTMPIACYTDDMGDVILIGERNPRQMPISIDDVIVAWRNRHTADIAASVDGVNAPKSQKKEEMAPTISLEPFPESEHKPYRYQVILTGIDMKHSHMGNVFYKSDLLLKMLNYGFESGQTNIPNENEISEYKDKMSLESYSPYVSNAIGGYNIYFSPSTVVAASDQYIGLQNFNIQILTGGVTKFQAELLQSGVPESIVEEFPYDTTTILTTTTDQLEIDIRKKLRSIPDATSVKINRQKVNTIELFIQTINRIKNNNSFKQLTTNTDGMSVKDLIIQKSTPEFLAYSYSKNFDSLSEKYPIWSSMEACLRLVALATSIEKHWKKYDYTAVKSLLQDSKIEIYDIPTEIPCAFSDITGVEFTQLRTGGIIPPIINEAKAGDLSQMRRLVFFHRPKDTDAILWYIPLDSTDVNHFFELNNDQKKLFAFLENDKSTVTDGYTIDLTLQSGKWSKWETPTAPRKPIPTIGWDPETNKKNRASVEGKFVFGTGDDMKIRMTQLSYDPPTEYFGTGYDVEAKYVFNNRVSATFNLPFRFLITNMGNVGGLQNATLGSTISVLPFHRSKPSLVMFGSLSTPFKAQIFDSTEKQYPFIFNGSSNAIGFSSVKFFGYSGKKMLSVSGYRSFNDLTVDGRSSRYISTSNTLRLEPIYTLKDGTMTSIAIEKEFNSKYGDTTSIEYSVYAGSRYVNERTYAGLSFSEGEVSYYYKINMPIDSLHYKKLWWF